MSDIERRLRNLEDRAALQDVLFEFWEAGDGLSDLEGALACFTEDAVIDMTALGLPSFEGHAAIRESFAEAFRDYAHLAHFGTNFRVIRLDGDDAECHVSVTAHATTRAGVETTNHVQYKLSYRRSGERWRISALSERLLMK
jgi:uncharacterized protein (TIGR02246 family)